MRLIVLAAVLTAVLSYGGNIKSNHNQNYEYPSADTAPQKPVVEFFWEIQIERPIEWHNLLFFIQQIIFQVQPNYGGYGGGSNTGSVFEIILLYKVMEILL